MPLLARVKDIFKGGSSIKKKKVYHNVKLDNPEETWEVIGELGDGAYGKVYKASRRENGQLAALKQVVLDGEDDLETFMIEIDILAECKHANIVQLFEAYHYDGKLWMYLEYCDGGAVDSIMVDLDRPLTEPQICTLCHEICNALIYIHSNKVIHRDLKAGNILLTMNGGVKLADFGVSAKNKNTLDKRGTFIGTPYWLAPEVILCETFIDAKYDYKADIWSLGISLIEFAQRDPPNHEVSPVRVMLKIQKSDPPKLDYPSLWSKEFNDFVAKCLTKDPELRPTAEELIKHPFLSKAIDKKPLIDLLLEYNAEVVEEEVDDDSEVQDYPSSVPEAFSNTSQFDRESVISLGKDSTLPTISDDVLSSPTSEDKEIGAAGGSEKRVSKGPAPPPPSNNQSSPKKGPAPAVPAGSTTPAALPTKENDAVDTSTINSTPASPDALISSFPPSPTLANSPLYQSTTSSPIKEAPVIVSQPTSPDTIVSTAVANIPQETCASPPKSIAPTSSLLEAEVNVIYAIPVAKSVTVFDTDTLVGVIPSTQDLVGEVSEEGLSPISMHPLSPASPISSELPQPPAVQEMAQDELSPVPVPPSTSSPVTLSVVAAKSNGASLDNSTQQPSDVLASISSEGTVIVRTPTPTNVSTPSPVVSETTVQVQTPAADSIVTYTVAGKSDTTEKKESAEEVLVPVSEPEKLHSPVGVTLVGQISQDSTISFESLGEAESQAVEILESAINSSLDAAFDALDIVTPPSSPTASLPKSMTETKAEVVIVASGNSEMDSELGDASVHRLDQSEVLISSSSIPEDEQTEGSKQSGTMEKGVSQEADPHVSVVAVAEETVGEVTIVKDDSTIVVDEDKSSPVSLTIEGTTVEDTHVDGVERPVISQMEASLEPSVNTHTDESVVLSEDNSSRTPSHTPTTTASSPVVPMHDQISQAVPSDVEGSPLKPIQNGVRRQNSRASDRSDTDTTSTFGSDKENRHGKDDGDFSDEVTLRSRGSPRHQPRRTNASSPSTMQKNSKNKELQESIALRKKTRKRTRKFVIDGVVVTTTTSKVIYGDDEEEGMLSSAHLKRKQELRELKLLQKREQKQFQDLSLKANSAKLEQEKKFEIEKANLLKNYDSQVENLIRQQKQMVEKAEARQESELKMESKKTRADQERELKTFRESLKQEWKVLKQEVDLLPKDKRKENFKIRKELLEKDQSEREKLCLERLNDFHVMALKRLNDHHCQHIALKEKQFLEEKHQLLRKREIALWALEERHIQDKHQLAKEQLKDIYFLQRLQMTNRHTIELEQVRRYNQQNEENLIKRQQEERRQLPKRIRQEMKTREKMFREQMRISMTNLASHDQEKDQLKKFQEQEKIKYDKERKRAEMKHKKQMEEQKVTCESSIKELVHLQNEKGKLLTEHETYKLKSLDEEYQKELREWKSNLVPRKKKLEDDFQREIEEQVKFYGDYLDQELVFSTSSHSMTSLTSSHQ